MAHRIYLLIHEVTINTSSTMDFHVHNIRKFLQVAMKFMESTCRTEVLESRATSQVHLSRVGEAENRVCYHELRLHRDGFDFRKLLKYLIQLQTFMFLSLLFLCVFLQGVISYK
jgi:hypothetical protein